jgi:hypothetical protein
MVLLYLPIPAPWSIWDRDFHGILVASVRGNQALNVSFGAPGTMFFLDVNEILIRFMGKTTGSLLLVISYDSNGI